MFSTNLPASHASRDLLGPTVHPFVNVTPEETPVLSDFGCGQFTDSCQLIDRGFWDAEKPRDLHHGEDFPIPCGARFRLIHRYCGSITIHDDWDIGVTTGKLEPRLPINSSHGRPFMSGL